MVRWAASAALPPLPQASRRPPEQSVLAMSSAAFSVVSEKAFNCWRSSAASCVLWSRILIIENLALDPLEAD